MNRKSRLQLITSALGLSVVGFGIWALFLKPLTVHIAAIELNAPVEVFGLGTVESRVTSKVGFKVAGVLVDLFADVGDRLTKGALLARLDDREQKAKFARTRAAIDQSEATLQRAMAGLEKAQANYVNAKAINERRQTLLRTNNTSVEAAQTSKAVEDAGHADVNLANSDILVAKAAISDAKAQQLQESATLDLHTLAAPYNAMVITRQKELGSALGAGEAVFTLIDPLSIWVLAYIDESKSGDIGVGQQARIALRSLPGKEFHGRVARIETEGDRVNEERRVQIAFDRIPDDFHLGEQAEVYIATRQLTRALLVPVTAIDGIYNGRGTVWTVEDGRFQRRTVTLGLRLLDGRYEIIDGGSGKMSIVDRIPTGARVGRSARILERGNP
jgi:HlyD family secretion protein